MADPKKMSELAAAVDILAAEFLVLQGGANKRAAISLLYASPPLTTPTAEASNGKALTLTQSLSAANAQSILDMAATWSTTGAPTALKMNVTDTASNAASLLADFQVGGASQFSVNKSGRLSANDIRVPATGTSNVRLTSNIMKMGSNGLLSWGSTSDVTSTSDVILVRDAANTLAQRNGTSAQASRLYFSYTDASNYTRMAFKTATGVHTIETESAGTGEANIDLALTPKGTGAVRFGTHAAIGAETVTGYITIKDAGGTSRKIAVVS